MTISIRNASPADIKRAKIYSNEDNSKTADLRGGLIRLMYYESLLQDTVRATVFYVDTGATVEKNGKLVSAVEGLPIVGEEKFELVFTDNNGNEIDFTVDGENALYVNKVTPVLDDTSKSLVMLDLVSKEYILNEKMRLNTRFDGPISEHVRGILTKQTIDPDGTKRQKDYFDTKKDVDIEETEGMYNFCGDNRKPFYCMNWLSKKAVPGENPKALGSSAGYFLWETGYTTDQDGEKTKGGFHFKSIDWLMNREVNPVKKSIIYTGTGDAAGEKIPQQYDMKALSAEKSNLIDIQQKLQMGAYSTRTIMFNPFDCVYEVITPYAYGSETEKGSQDNLKLGGDKLPVMNKEFDRPASKEFSRTQYMLLDPGTLVTAVEKNPSDWSEGTNSQLAKSQTDQNFEVQDILSQSSMRYNQLFSIKVTVTIPGDFSLHAGNSIFFDGPELTDSENKDNIDEQTGGLYIISDICHYSSDKQTFTKMNLVRDSIDRKGSPSGG
tara:strand:- start:439 stop:1923 length:1485 start_codon:yes stop_codon:yes gene_type:complete